KLTLAAVSMACALSVLGQGTVTFNNRVVGAGGVVTHVYGANPGNPSTSQVGNGSTDSPAGATDWSAYTALSGANYFAQLLAANGANQAEASLVPATPTTTFRTGAAAGFVNPVTATLVGVPGDSPAATLEMVVWNNASGL